MQIDMDNLEAYPKLNSLKKIFSGFKDFLKLGIRSAHRA
jgi:hypothetical protein